MNNKIINITKLVLSTGVILGVVTFAGAASTVSSGASTIGSGATAGTIGTTSVGSTSVVGSTTTDPCGGTGGSGSTWTPPGSAPHAGNVAAPINGSSSPQFKDGKLTIGSLPCPMPISGWTPGSKLTVNGVTDTTGFSNWGATFLQGKVAVGANWASAGTTPMLYVKPPSFTTAAAVFGGSVGVRGSLGIAQGDGSVVCSMSGCSMPGYNTLYVQSVPVCLANGSNCPAAAAAAISNWAASGANIYNTNTGNVGIGTTSPDQTLTVNGVIHSTGNLYAGGQGIISSGLRVGPGGAPSSMLTVAGNADITGGMSVGTNLTVGNTLKTAQLWVGDPPGAPSVLFTTGDGHAMWKAVRAVRYGCGPAAEYEYSNIRDGRILVMDEAGTSSHCHGGDPDGTHSIYGYLLVP